MTMTFLYGAVHLRGSETVYGWVAREALRAANHAVLIGEQK
jgi:hypothetical protein